MESYCLRLLLRQIKGPISFIDLKIINGIVYDTFKQACDAFKLLEDDGHWKYTIQEAILSKNTKQIGELSILLMPCSLRFPKNMATEKICLMTFYIEIVLISRLQSMIQFMMTPFF